MQAIGETGFDAIYLITVITVGIIMILKSKGSREFTLFGIMAVVLGAGDSFISIATSVSWFSHFAKQERQENRELPKATQLADVRAGI